MAERLASDLRRGDHEAYDFIHSEDFDPFVDLLHGAAAMHATDEIDTDTFRQKLIDTLWRPRLDGGVA